MKCPSCKTDNPSDAAFCEQCGSKLELVCPACKTAVSPEARFCKKCGTAIAASVKKSTGPIRIAETAAPETIDGERKVVTFLFADIKGSMDLMEDLDPEDARAIVDPALKLMMEAVHHYGGYVAQPTGDGIFALFGAPIAHEDHPQRALFAALRLQEEMRRYSAKLRMAGNLPVEARVGVNTGEVVVRSIRTGQGKVEYAPIGHSTGLAARMQALAPTGSIAATDQVRKLCEGYFTFKTLGPTKVKGVTEPIDVYEVTGFGPLRTRLQRSASRGYTKFVGRQREMEALRHCAELARQGHGQIVGVVAEAGVGKSRLFDEFKARNESGWMVLEALSFSHGKASAYLPVLDLLQTYFGIEPDDDSRKRREKVNGKVLTLDRVLEDSLPHLLGLLGLNEGDDPLAGMDAQIRQRRMVEALKRILLRESLNQPLIVILEDLHCIDQETQALLNLLADSIGTSRVLLLVNYRPEYSHQWSNKTYYTQLRLDPLGRESAGEMLDALLGVNAQTIDSQLAPLKRLIFEKTEGNPLFMEEIVQALTEEGALVRNGAVKLTRPLGALEVPPTVQDIIASRIDRLPAAEKELLQTLAVIGMEFTLALAGEVTKKPDDQLDRLLNDLQLAEFIYEQPAPGDMEYIFKHSLTHDVAYKSLLTERRTLLHDRAGQAMEALYHERLADHYDDLARHYRASTNTAKAVEYLTLAGRQAARRSLYAQALADVEPALELVAKLPDGSERLRAELGVRLTEMICAPVYGFASEKRFQASQRVCELSERLCDVSALLCGLVNVGLAYSNRGEALRSQEIARRCLELAEQNLHDEMPVAVQNLLAASAERSGDLLEASSLFSHSMESLGSTPGRGATEFIAVNLWVVTPMLFAEVKLELGRPDQALELSDEALRRGREVKHPLSLAAVSGNGAFLRYQCREHEGARELAEAAMAIAEENGIRDWSAVCRSVRGGALTELGQAVRGIEELEAGAASLQSFFRTPASMMLAKAYVHVGRVEEAAVIVDEELARIERAGAGQGAAELYRIKGEAILGRDRSATAEAEKCFRKAIEIAKGQSAKWWELRATVNLARLLRDTARHDEAREMLAAIYNWFTEGFDTADLKDAKALLEELSGGQVPSGIT
jgi:class 3 adenylate cyclase/tetratricopeptide (TPR) repeat protein